MPANYSFEALGLLDDCIDESLQNIIDLASSMLKTPISYASLIERNKLRQFFPVMHGLPQELQEARETPIEESICSFVQQKDKTITIQDLLLDGRTKDNPLVHRHSLRSYLGTPIHAPSGEAIGALCCLDIQPTPWSAQDIDTLEKLARCVDDNIRARSVALDQRKVFEKMTQMAAARSGFIAHMSHEIRTPLTGLIGSIRLLHNMNIEGHTGDLVSLLNRSSLRLLDVVNDSLEIAKLDAGNFKLVEEAFDIGVLINDITDVYRDLASSKAIGLTIANDLAESTYILDSKAIETVVQNLIGNAVKFTEAGSVHIYLSEDAQGQVVISVADTGIGIPEEYHATIFEEFEQAGPRIARKYGGTGLGMAIVKRLVEMMDGSIKLQSRLHEGTTITITLPLRQVATAA